LYIFFFARKARLIISYNNSPQNLKNTQLQLRIAFLHTKIKQLRKITRR